MFQNKNKRLARVFLFLGMLLLLLGFFTDQTYFSWAAAVLVLLALFFGGLRPRRK